MCLPGRDIFRVTNAGWYGKLKAQTLTGRHGCRAGLSQAGMHGRGAENNGFRTDAAADVSAVIRLVKRIAE